MPNPLNLFYMYDMLNIWLPLSHQLSFPNSSLDIGETWCHLPSPWGDFCLTWPCTGNAWAVMATVISYIQLPCSILKRWSATNISGFYRLSATCSAEIYQEGCGPRVFHRLSLYKLNMSGFLCSSLSTLKWI